MIAASACLCGLHTKYNGGTNTVDVIEEMYRKGLVIAICPEMLGGLVIPRVPSEILNDKVISKDGIDVSKFFLLGANKVLEILKKNEIDMVILKENSPSCGTHFVYDGTFSKKLIPGMGICAKVLQDNGYKVVSDLDFMKEYRCMK